MLPTVLQNMMGLLINASTDKYEFLGKIRFLNMVYRNLKMWKVFEASLEFLSKKEPHIYELFLLHLKLYLEYLEESKSRKFKDYEIMRLEHFQDIDTVVLEGYCSSCKDSCIMPMKTMDHLREYIESYISKKYISNRLCLIYNKDYLHFEQIVDSQSALAYFDDTVLNTNQSIEKDLINKIFDFDKNENIFTEKAQQYQWIIQFLSDGNHHKITDTQDWVLARVPHLFNIEINKTPSENKRRTNGLFNRHLDNLEKWNIIKSRLDKSSIDGINTRKFQLSAFGKMVASIIDAILSENKEIRYDGLFDSWKLHLTVYSSSLNLFCIKYLDKCKEEGLFHEFADFYLKSFTSGKNQYIQNINDLFTQMILVRFNDNHQNSLLFDIWKKSFDELDEKTRILFSNYMKIYLNRITLSNVFDYREYELKRFEVRNRTDLVIVEVCCSFCSNFQYIVVDIISYLSYFFDQLDKNMKDSLTALKCKDCQANINNDYTILVNFSDF